MKIQLCRRDIMRCVWEITARYDILTASGSAVLLGSDTLAAKGGLK
jgi:hypothetical protein